MYRTLQDFVTALNAAGELRVIEEPTSPLLDITRIADAESKSKAPRAPGPSALRTDPRFFDMGGRALLFRNVQGCDFPLLINAWGSYSRMELALGLAGKTQEPSGFEALAARIAELTKPQPPRSFSEVIEKAKQFLPLLRIPPKRRSGRGVSQEVIKTGAAIDCTKLPIIRCWPLDGDFASVGYPPDTNDRVEGISRGSEWNAKHRGRYITLAGIHTIHADERDAKAPASHNIGMYRVQLLGPQTLAMHWHMHHDGARHWRSWKKLGQPMPVAIALGGESVMPYAATAPLPPGISELLLAGFLHGKGIEMVRGATVPLWVPANAEIVIEGFVSHEAGMIGWDPRKSNEPLGPGAVFEGPFGDHTGFYSLPDRYPLLTVTAITHRKNAIYPTTIVGLPPQEDYYLGKATERVFLPLLRTIVHDIDDYDLPLFGTFHNCAMVQIAKAYPLQGRRVMHSVWGAGQMAWTKTIFVVGSDVNVHDTFAVLREAGKWCVPSRDVERVRGPLDILDHAAPRLGAGMKIGFDCTRKTADEALGGVNELNERNAMSADEARAYVSQITALPGVQAAACPAQLGFAWLFIRVQKDHDHQGVQVLERVFALHTAHSAFQVDAEKLPPFVIVVGDEQGTVGGEPFCATDSDIDDVLFHWCASCDASRDSVEDSSTTRGRIGFDATKKRETESRKGEPVRPFPPVLPKKL
jgi:4-hydroxy-3-polyprenylbenzoate decarboxylase